MYQRYYAIGFMALALFAAGLYVKPALAAAAADDTVIATVNGDKIMKKDVMAAIKKLPIQSKDTEKVFPMVVDEIINEKLIDDATNAAKIEQSDEYKKQLDALKSQLAKQMYVDKFLHDKVSDKVVKAEYAKFKKANEGKQEVHAKHLLVKSDEEAKQAIKDLDDGAKFEDLVKQRSSDTASAANGGDLGWFAEEDMLPEFSKAAFALKPGSYSKEPVKTRFGYHVIYVIDKRARQVPPLEGPVSDAIRKKLSQDAVKDLIESLRSKAQIKMFDINGKPLDYGSKKDKDDEDKPSKSDEKSGDADEKSDKSDKAAEDKPAKSDEPESDLTKE
jgi:peptidyl-prolyl cis-trans isomerase C